MDVVEEEEFEAIKAIYGDDCVVGERAVRVTLHCAREYSSCNKKDPTHDSTSQHICAVSIRVLQPMGDKLARNFSTEYPPNHHTRKPQ
jgi:hypothetical protein